MTLRRVSTELDAEFVRSLASGDAGANRSVRTFVLELEDGLVVVQEGEEHVALVPLNALLVDSEVKVRF